MNVELKKIQVNDLSFPPFYIFSFNDILPYFFTYIRGTYIFLIYTANKTGDGLMFWIFHIEKLNVELEK